MSKSAGRVAIQPLLGTLVLLACAIVPFSVASWPARLQATLRNDAPNARDYAQIEHNYYERILDDPHPHGAQSAAFNPGALATAVDDIREYVLKPSLHTMHKGATWTTNARGMRDRTYNEIPPANMLRVALVGDSIASSWGVNDGEGFEPRLENAWRMEILNFAVPGHSPGQRWEHFSRVGWEMRPDVVIVESTLADIGWDERRLRVLLPKGHGLDAPVFAETLRKLAVDPTKLSPAELKTKLHPLRTELLAGIYRQIVSDCHSRGVPVVWLLLPRVGKPVDPETHATLTNLAKSAGFDRLVDVSGIFDGQSASKLAIAPDDFHPNALGHAQLTVAIDAQLSDFMSSLTVRSRPVKWEDPSSPHHAPANFPSGSTQAGVNVR